MIAHSGRIATPCFGREHELKGVQFDDFRERVASCSSKDWQVALALLREIPDKRLRLNEQQYCATIAVVLKKSLWQCAQVLMRDMSAAGCQRDLSIRTCMRCNHWHAAAALMHDMAVARSKPSDSLYRDVISSMSRTRGLWHLALALLLDLPTLGMTFNPPLVGLVITACGNDHQWQTALTLFRNLPGMMPQSKQIICDRTARACDKGGSWQWALALLREMSATELQPTAESFRLEIGAWGHGLQWQRALALLREMPTRTLEPSAITYDTFIRACECSGIWEVALEALREMPTVRMQPYEHSYSSCILALEAEEDWHRALTLLREMPLMGMTPGEITYGSVIQVCGAAPVGQMVFLEAVRKGVFPELLSDGDLAVDLHSCTAWTAIHAVWWWLMKRVPTVLAANPSATKLTIITGHSRNPERSDRRVKDAVAHLLDAVALPYRTLRDNEGVWVIRADDYRDAQH